MSDKKIKARERNLKKLYSLTLADYEQIKIYQNGVCAICFRPPKTKAHAVDHDHKTGLIRGLLCSNCNAAIGKFRDNLELIKKAVEYLENPPATTALNEQRYGIKGRVGNKMKTMRRLNPDRFPAKQK